MGMKKGMIFGGIILLIALCAAVIIIYSPKQKAITNPIVTNPIETQKEAGPKTSGETAPVFTKEIYPKVDGATAMIPLGGEIAKTLLKMSPEEAKAFIKFSTTHPAYVNLIEKKADIVLAFGPSEDEKNLAKSKGEELEIIPIGRDGFIFMANVENPVTNLTVKQIQDIYQNKIANWKEVGGEDAQILAYQRPQNSGSQTSMERLVMKDIKMPSIPTKVVETMGGAIEKVAVEPGAKNSIVYSFYYYAKEMYAKKEARFMAVNGILPSTKTIKDKSYPFTEDVCAVIRKSEPKDSSARKLIEWLLSDEGQKVVERGGYVKIK
ncbi:MAG: PstS family phosphate ABC transporter substrate-binding protein [Ignavibacteriales bacterium]